MANCIQKMFLSKKKLAILEQQEEILRLVALKPITHRAYMLKSGAVVRRFTIDNGSYKLFAERSCDTSYPENQQIQFYLRVYQPAHLQLATHSDIDKFPKRVYTKMYKLWEQSRKQKTK